MPRFMNPIHKPLVEQEGAIGHAVRPGYIYSEGFRLKNAEVQGEQAEFANQEEAATVRNVPSATTNVEWKTTFST